MTTLELTDEQRWELMETFSRALDRGVASAPRTPQDFACTVLSHFLSGLVETRALQPTQILHFNTLANLYALPSNRREVKT